ncbi:hypothetical protein [Micrococcus sp.]|uniref:hypothetical protein n=1 Tax=Micrococcus sp. TaxID=1271 RepID=UPI002A920294|nr:hypothetical protein [Micrococcus sp.]MDY6056161.1 hypothetical protein [Micrococcus sp.]
MSRPRGGRARAPHRARTALLALVTVLALVLAVPTVRVLDLTVHPRVDAPEHVDALLVLYSRPEVYDAALDLAGRGVADHLFVSAHMGPDGHEKLCGEQAHTDPRLAGVSVECFDPSPVTTQGEAVYAARRMHELGLHDLGVLTFGQHIERARLLTTRCWAPEDGTVSMYAFDPGLGRLEAARHTLYGVLAHGKAALTPGCDQELPGPVNWALDVVKDLRGQPVSTGAAATVPAVRGGTR